MIENDKAPHPRNRLKEVSIQEQLGNEVRKWRKSQSLSQAELADLSGTSQSALAHIEAGKGNPTLGTIDRILHILGKRASIRFMPALPPSNESERPSNQPQS
ncbi:MAG: helix-turn-helix domain-containing protein [Candidatus Saccharibacteria bacterium]